MMLPINRWLWKWILKISSSRWEHGNRRFWSVVAKGKHICSREIHGIGARPLPVVRVSGWGSCKKSNLPGFLWDQGRTQPSEITSVLIRNYRLVVWAYLEGTSGARINLGEHKISHQFPRQYFHDLLVETELLTSWSDMILFGKGLGDADLSWKFIGVWS